MKLVLNEEQQMLKQSAKELFKERGSISILRQLRDEKDATGYSTSLYAEMAELGLTALIIPEEHGGINFGYTGIGQVLEESGRTLTASPLLSTALISTSAINLGGSDALKTDILPQIAAGESVIALAIDENGHHRPSHIKTSAVRDGDNFVINGAKSFVLDGHVANKFVVVANVADKGNCLFVVDAEQAGITTERVIMMDSRNAANVSFNNVSVPATQLLDSYDGDLTQAVCDIASTGIASEMLGGMIEAFERTVAYLKEREQFGVKIGTFQALQHRAADMFCEIEMCKSIVIKALKALDANHEDSSKLASLAKAKCGQIYKVVSNEGIQMFGGIGMTDDEEIGFFLKRARVAQHSFGDTNYHLDRLAKMKGY